MIESPPPYSLLTGPLAEIKSFIIIIFSIVEGFWGVMGGFGFVDFVFK